MLLQTISSMQVCIYAYFIACGLARTEELAWSTFINLILILQSNSAVELSPQHKNDELVISWELSRKLQEYKIYTLVCPCINRL